MDRLRGQVAIVTGGAQGIGGATSRLLAREGARVLIADIDAETAHQNAAGIRETGQTADAMRCDVSKDTEIEAMVARAVDSWGRLDILVNNAYGEIGGDGDAVRLEKKAWDYGMDMMTTAVFLSAKYAIPIMQRQEAGSIVNIASVHGQLMAPGFLTYETGKAALIGMTRQMAIEYGPIGVRVNAICPGHIVTEKGKAMWDRNRSKLRFFERQYPLRKVGKTDDIANAIAFLCSDEASFITGHTLVVDGGLTIQLQENFGLDQARFMRDNPETQLD